MAPQVPIQSFKLDEEGLAHIFGELEAQLMEAVWVLDEPSVHEVIDHLGGDLNYKTVMTVLNRLVEKEVLKRRKRGRAFLYTATASRKELLAGVFDKVVRGMFNCGQRQIALAQIIDTAEAIDVQILDELSRLIEAKKQDKAGPMEETLQTADEN